MHYDGYSRGGTNWNFQAMQTRIEIESRSRQLRQNTFTYGTIPLMVDEVFAHRLGMIPLNVDPALLEMK